MAENQTAQQPVPHASDENALSHRIAQKADKLKFVLLGVFVVIAVVVALFLYMGSSKAKSEAAAADAVFSSFVQLQGKTPAEAAPALAATAKQYAGQPAGVQAAVHALGTAMDAKQYADAEKVGQDFIRNYPKSALIPRVRLAIAQAQLHQGKTAAAIEALRTVASAAGPDTMPESKLALAQALEQHAEEAKDNPEEYRRRLEAAQVEFTDITSRARLASPAQRGFWPQAVTLTADYALVQIKDRLAGHELGTPSSMSVDAAVTPAELETVQNLRPPSAADDDDVVGERDDSVVAPPLIGITEPAAVAEEAAKAAESALEQAVQALEGVGEKAEAAVEPVAEKAAEVAEKAEEAVAESAKAAEAKLESAAEAVEEAVEEIVREGEAEAEKVFGAAARLRARAVGSAPAEAAPEAK